jgi:NADH-quinone oxidoreductase subunit C
MTTDASGAGQGPGQGAWAKAPEELAAAVAERLGAAGTDCTTEVSFGAVTVDVPPAAWVESLRAARDDLGCDFFDWLTAVDELADGFAIVAHVFSLTGRHHLFVRTRVPRESPALARAVPVYRGANWHERETYEMFGVDFTDHPDLRPLLLPDGFEGHPLRKEFVLASRVVKPWPGAKEPGESGRGAPSRRRMLPPGVPADWGPGARTATGRDDPGSAPGASRTRDGRDARAGEAGGDTGGDTGGDGGGGAGGDHA